MEHCWILWHTSWYPGRLSSHAQFMLHIYSDERSAQKDAYAIMDRLHGQHASVARPEKGTWALCFEGEDIYGDPVVYNLIVEKNDIHNKAVEEES